MTTTASVSYEGPLEGAYDLVDELRDAGIDIEWVPPPEERTNVAEAIAIAIVARGSYDALLAVIRRVRERLGSRAKISAEKVAPAESGDGAQPGAPH